MARVVGEYRQTQPPARVARRRQVSLVDLTLKNFFPRNDCPEDFELWRNYHQVSVAADFELAFSGQTDDKRRRIGRHGNGFMQWHANFGDHSANQIDHARSAAGECGAIGEQTNAAFHNAFRPVKRKLRAVRQTSSGGSISYETDSANTLCTIQ